MVVELLLIGLAINWCASVLHGTRGMRVERVAKADLAAVLAAEPRTHVLALRRDLPELGMGTPLIASGPAEDARVLVALRTLGPLVSAP